MPLRASILETARLLWHIPTHRIHRLSHTKLRLPLPKFKLSRQRSARPNLNSDWRQQSVRTSSATPLCESLQSQSIPSMCDVSGAKVSSGWHHLHIASIAYIYCASAFARFARTGSLYASIPHSAYAEQHILRCAYAIRTYEPACNNRSFLHTVLSSPSLARIIREV